MYCKDFSLHNVAGILLSLPFRMNNHVTDAQSRDSVFLFLSAEMGFLTVRLTTMLSLGSGVTAVTGSSAAAFLR